MGATSSDAHAATILALPATVAAIAVAMAETYVATPAAVAVPHAITDRATAARPPAIGAIAEAAEPRARDISAATATTSPEMPCSADRSGPTDATIS